MQEGNDGSGFASADAARPGINPREWMKREPQEHLPEFMRDFHDAKDVFKLIESTFKAIPELSQHTWISNQIYTVDFFLWFCGIHGYTLQRCRKKGVAFEELAPKLEAMRARSMRSLAALLTSVDEAPKASPASPATKEPEQSPSSSHPQGNPQERTTP